MHIEYFVCTYDVCMYVCTYSKCSEYMTNLTAPEYPFHHELAIQRLQLGPDKRSACSVSVRQGPHANECVYTVDGVEFASETYSVFAICLRCLRAPQNLNVGYDVVWRTQVVVCNGIEFASATTKHQH